MPIVGAVGRHILALLSFLGQATRLFVEACSHIVRLRVDVRATSQQMAEAGVSSLPIAMVTIVFSSMVFSYYVVKQSLRYFEGGFVGELLGEAIFRELILLMSGQAEAMEAAGFDGEASDEERRAA